MQTGNATKLNHERVWHDAYSTQFLSHKLDLVADSQVLQSSTCTDFDQESQSTATLSSMVDPIIPELRSPATDQLVQARKMNSSTRNSSSFTVYSTSDQGSFDCDEPSINQDEWEDIERSDTKNTNLSKAKEHHNHANSVIQNLKDSLTKTRLKSSQLSFHVRLLKFEIVEVVQRQKVEINLARREIDKLRFDLMKLQREHDDFQRHTTIGRQDVSKYRTRLIKTQNRLQQSNQKLDKQEQELQILRDICGKHTKSQLAVARTRPTKPVQNGSDGKQRSSSDEQTGLAALGMLANQVLQQQHVNVTNQQETAPRSMDAYDTDLEDENLTQGR
ncbi:hypothetical protein V1514DRAFT_323543 [Lipomyces japonicus]|uniref:uncharacterized protein n=1 Tax=Lipomyces japonicus TaxID=56871 RepID=UPI0034CFEA91